MSDEIESMRKCNRCKASFTLENFNIKNMRGEYTKACTKCLAKRVELKDDYYYKNPEKVNEHYMRRFVMCECGKRYTKYNAVNHCAFSLPHLKWRDSHGDVDSIAMVARRI